VKVDGSSAVPCVAWVRGDWNLLRRARRREERLSVGVIGSGGAGGGGSGTEAIGPARNETCSGNALKTITHSTPRPSQLKQKLPLSGDCMVHCCTSLTRSNRATRLSLLATLNSSSLSSVSSLLSVLSRCCQYYLFLEMLPWRFALLARLLPSMWRQRCNDGCRDFWMDVGWSRSGLVSFLFRSLSLSLSLSKVSSARSHAVCVSDVGRCGRVSERCVHGSLWLYRVREISTYVLVAGSDSVLRLTNTEADGWEYCLIPSIEIRCSCLKTFLQRDIEDAPIYGKHEWATCVYHGHELLCCLTSAGARLVETISGRERVWMPTDISRGYGLAYRRM
jgi:hypothetical protein